MTVYLRDVFPAPGQPGIRYDMRLEVFGELYALSRLHLQRQLLQVQREIRTRVAQGLDIHDQFWRERHILDALRTRD